MDATRLIQAWRDALRDPQKSWVLFENGTGYVAPDEIDEVAEDVVIGLFGRSKRGQDAEELRVLRFEDNRSDTPERQSNS